MTSAWIGLGANLGDPLTSFAHALELLAESESTRLVAVSSAYRSAPWGRTDQPVFLNAVVQVETSLSARSLLQSLLTIERQLGRVRSGERWGPRLIDLDLLVYGGFSIREPDLQVPHPRLSERAFVLVPLGELDPGLDVPGLGRVDEMLAALDDEERRSVDVESTRSLDEILHRVKKS